MNNMHKVTYLIVYMLFILNFSSCNEPSSVSAEREGVLTGTSRLSELLGVDDKVEFPRVLTPRVFDFPRDHGPHDEFRNEWWYVTGNLTGPKAEVFGYELTFFRFSMAPATDRENFSEWKTNQVYIAHFAVTDAAAKTFYVSQRYSRGGAGLAGAQSAPFSVWLDNWKIAAGGEVEDEELWRLTARSDDTEDDVFAVDIQLVSLKPPVLNGINGLSQKSAQPGNASYYYSLTRLESQGTVRIGTEVYAVSGNSWMDREWGSSALSSDQVGWDWFALQLSDGTDLMFYNIRRNDGSSDDRSAGTWVAENGDSSYLALDDVSVVVLDHWNNDRGDTYPSRWRIEIPSKELALTVSPILDDQELVTNVRYWEGAVEVAGKHAERPIAGRGYVELTGYAN